MVLDSERWLELRRFRALRESGLSIAEIARQTRLNRRTVTNYLAAETPPVPPRPSSRAGSRPQVLAPFMHVIDAWLGAELLLKVTVIHERLVEQSGFTGNYQRVKLYLPEARPRIAGEMGIGPFRRQMSRRMSRPDRAAGQEHEQPQCGRDDAGGAEQGAVLEAVGASRDEELVDYPVHDGGLGRAADQCHGGEDLVSDRAARL